MIHILSQHLLSPSFAPGTKLSALYTLCSLTFHNNPMRYYNYPHFTDEDIEFREVI